MKELNLPENQLRGWQPRRPSAGLKPRLFRAAADSPAPSWNWPRLAPAMACLFFLLMAAHFNGVGLISQPRLAAAMTTNQGGVFWGGESGQVSENQMAGVTFDWTNHGNFHSSIAFASKTNSSN